MKYKEFELIGSSFKCDKNCPYCTAKITKWPVVENKFELLEERLKYLRDNNMLRVSRSLKDLAYRVISMQEYLTNKLGYTPTYEEIAKNLNEDLIDVLVAIESTYEPVSIYTPIYNDGGDTIYLYEQIEDKKNIEY